VIKDDWQLRNLLGWDEPWYLQRYPDVAQACSRGAFFDGLQHYLLFGRHEGRYPSAAAEQARRSPLPARFSIGRYEVPSDWPVKGEPATTFLVRLSNGFFCDYLSGDVVLDIGYKGGGKEEAVPIFPHAFGIDLDYPGYDGLHLPFDDESVDAVFASHVLEHIPQYHTAIGEWFRVLRQGGFLVCIVPHQFLYEKRAGLPSKWNPDHKRFYTPAGLLREIEEALPSNTYRVRHLRDNDYGYLYSIEPDKHPGGCYEIELVIEKIVPPAWSLAGTP